MARRGGFTLMELMVSLGVMAALITMITMIFATATKSSSEAQNLAAAHRQFRMAARNLHEDLESTLPGSTNECFLAIAGREVSAHETAARRSAGEAATPRHADVLALLTNRSFTSFINQNPAIVFGNKQLVVYGHADIGEFDPATGDFDNASILRVEPPTSGGVSDLLASQWHLARRIIGIPFSASPAYEHPSGGRVNVQISGTDGLAYVEFEYPFDQTFTRPEFLRADADACDRFYPRILTDMALPKGVFVYNYTTPTSISYYFFYQNNWYLLNQQGSQEYWYVFDGGHWFADPRTAGSGDPCYGTSPYSWWRQEEGYPAYPDPSALPPACADWPRNAPERHQIDAFPANWFFYPDESIPDYIDRRRSLIDPTPPLGQDRRMAHHFLPGCSEFKVEFTYDDPRELATEYNGTTRELKILDYAWKRTNDDKNYMPKDATTIVPAPMPIRWQEVPHGEIYVWSGVEVEPKLYGTNDKLQNQTLPLRWPRAIRITLRSYGPLGRLERPIEQTIIHTFRDK